MAKVLETEQPEPSAADIIVEAFEAGRPIVPFLAAGVSIDTGFPSMTAITAYLAKVRYWVGRIEKSPRVSDYLRRNGWPDLPQLNAKTWRFVAAQDGGGGPADGKNAFEDLATSTAAVIRVNLDPSKSTLDPALSAALEQGRAA